ncbi:acyl-CoA thioesterase [Anaerosinus massiliensis]|uniref:acyl-CoA thioesterase n=1 Tax=Massilibacillus massiliensis TaxID=1806837 RepID=UPI000A855D46|nr:thioesterase family protein [Massilibacillus massiliensis]
MGQVRVKVNFFDTDAMAVVHHANYLRWFEIGRVEFLREAGITLNELMEDQIVFPIIDVTCKYRSSARFDDLVMIETIPTTLTQLKMIFEYKVLREADGELLAEGRTQSVFTSKETGKIIRLPKKYFDRLKSLV